MSTYFETAAINVTNNTQVTTAGMGSNGGLVSYSVGALDGLTLNATKNVVTTDGAGQNFYPTHVIVTATTVTGALVSPASVSLGSNGSTTNLLAATALTALGTAGLYLAIPLSVLATRVAPGQTITAKITVAAVGPTVLTLQVTVAGFYAP